MTQMMNRQKLLQTLPAVERYGATFLAVVCTLTIRLVLDPMLGDRAPYMLFILTLVIIKRLWGRGPGLLATLLGGIAAWYFILVPRFSFVLAHRADAINLVGYFAVGAGISFLGEKSGRVTASSITGGKSPKIRVLRQTAVLAGAAVVLAVMLMLLLRDFKRTQEAEGWVAHTYQVMNAAESVIAQMNDAETGQRGFLLTGDERYLKPYNSALATLPDGFKELKDLTADNPSQQARCVEINRLIDERLDLLNRGIELRKAATADATTSFVRSQQQDPTMDKLRSTLDAVMSEEHRLLRARTAEAALRATRGRWVLGFGSGALVLLLVFASVVIERETTRREKITEDLRRHASLLEQAHDALLTCRLGGAIDYWSRGAEALFGYTQAEAVRRSSHELLQTQHPMGMSQMDALLERDGYWDGELIQTTKDGRKLVVEARWSVALDANGNKIILEANRDITERKQAEKEVRQSEAILRSFFDSPGMMRGMVELVDGRIIHVSCNEAAAGLFGHSRSAIAGKTATEAGASDDVVRAWVALYEKARSTGKPASGEYARVDAQGKERWLLATASYMGFADSGHPRFAYTILDFTDRRHAEEALRQSEARLRTLGDNLPDGAIFRYCIDANGQPRVDFISAGIERLTGVPASEFMADAATVDRNMFPEDRERMNTAIRLSHQNLTQFEVEVRHKHRVTGETHWSLLRSTPVRCPDGSTEWNGIEIDITGRKQIEQALRESESRERARAAEFEALMEAAPVGIFKSSDAECRKMSGNRRAYDMLRRPRLTNLSKTGPESERPANFRAMKDGKEIPLSELPMQKAAATGKSVRNFEMEFVFVDGVTRIVLGDAVPLLDESGRPRGAIGAFVDITERKRAEAENVLLATAIDQAAETVVITDRDAKIQYVNPAFSRTTGYTRDEALGQNPRVLKSGQHEVKFYRELWASLTAGKLWRGEFTNRRKDGTLYIEDATIAPVRDSSGIITNFIAIKSDITERKRGEIALRESETMLRFFVQHAPAAIAMLDREMRYLVVSRRWISDYHLEDRELVGHSHYEIFPEVPERWKEIHQRCLAGGVENCEEDPFPRPDGTVDWVHWEVRPRRKFDESIGGVIIFSEVITGRKRAEAALEESELRYRQLLSDRKARWPCTRCFSTRREPQRFSLSGR